MCTKVKFWGLEGWLHDSECLLLFQGTHVWFPAPTPEGSQRPGTLTSEGQTISGLPGHQHPHPHVYIQTRNMHINKNKFQF